MVYETNEPIAYQREGHEVNLIKARSYGLTSALDIYIYDRKDHQRKASCS